MKRRTSQALVVATVALVATLLLPVGFAAAQSPSAGTPQLAQAYAAVQQAESRGGNVTGLVAQLNQAIALIQRGDSINGTDPAGAQSLYSQASAILQQVIANAPAVGSAGAAAARTALYELGAETVVLAVLAIAAYLYTPRLFWRAWLRLHRGWRVRKA